MEIPISEAKARLADLVRRAEKGDNVVLTRHGRPIVRLARVEGQRLTPAERRALLMELQASAMRKVTEGPDAARSQDFLYDEFGLPK
jgi:prevent-host-death family protein